MVVVGAGYVGVEVAEAALRRGFGVTVLTRTRGMSMLEDEMSDLVNDGLVEAGVELVLGAEVTGLDARRRPGDRRALGRRHAARPTSSWSRSAYDPPRRSWRARASS